MDRKPVHVAMFSGGASSAYAAYTMVQKYGKENCILFFTNTLWEDEDNYRFMDEVAEYLGVELTERLDGRNPEEVFHDTRFLGNSRMAKCSEVLKVRQTVLFIDDELINKRNLQPILYFGIGPHEKHRADRLTEFYEHNCIEPIESRFPMIDSYVEEGRVRDIIENEWGIKLPRMYYYEYTEGDEKGQKIFTHANCGGRCVRGGFQHYKGLYLVWKDQYMKQEEMEERFRKEFDKNVSILKKDSKPYTLKRYRTEILERLDNVEVKEKFEELRAQDNEDVIPCVCTFS